MMGQTALAAGILILTQSVLCAGAPYEKSIQTIDRHVFEIDKRLDGWTKTSNDHCEDQVCTRTVAYWDAKGRIQKSVQEIRPQVGSGKVTGRYFRNCRLTLVRVAPNDTETVKNPQSIEKFYFLKGKLLRAVFGEEVQAFSKDQMSYYERTLGADPKVCVQNVQ